MAQPREVTLILLEGDWLDQESGEAAPRVLPSITVVCRAEHGRAGQCLLPGYR